MSDPVPVKITGKMVSMAVPCGILLGVLGTPPSMQKVFKRLETMPGVWVFLVGLLPYEFE